MNLTPDRIPVKTINLEGLPARQLLDSLASPKFISLVAEPKIWVLTFVEDGEVQRKYSGHLDSLLMWWVDYVEGD